MAKIEDEENGQGNICGEEVGNVPIRRHKDLKAVGEGEQRDDEEGKVSEVWLEQCAVRQGMKNAVEDHSFAEADVGDHDDDPGDEAGNGGDVGEPEEDLGAGVGDVEVGKETDYPGSEDGDVWDAFFAGSAEDLGGFAVEGHAIEDARAGEEEGVAGGPGGCQDGGVDNVVQACDAGSLDADDEGRR